jgi:hypothetical protein
MYHNCASLCALCEGKEGAKKMLHLTFFINYRNKNHHASEYFLCLLAKFSLVSSDCVFRILKLNDFDWTKLGIIVLTCLV